MMIYDIMRGFIRLRIYKFCPAVVGVVVGIRVGRWVRVSVVRAPMVPGPTRSVGSWPVSLRGLWSVVRAWARARRGPSAWCPSSVLGPVVRPRGVRRPCLGPCPATGTSLGPRAFRPAHGHGRCPCQLPWTLVAPYPHCWWSAKN